MSNGVLCRGWHSDCLAHAASMHCLTSIRAMHEGLVAFSYMQSQRTYGVKGGGAADDDGGPHVPHRAQEHAQQLQQKLPIACMLLHEPGMHRHDQVSCPDRYDCMHALCKDGIVSLLHRLDASRISRS